MPASGLAPERKWRHLDTMQFATGNEVLGKQFQAIERKLQEELSTALAQSNSAVVESGSASVGLAALALGAAGLRRRRKAATAA